MRCRPLVPLLLYRHVIPRIIHQIWLGPKSPPRYTMDSCRLANRGWQYRVWTERDSFPLINRRLFDSYRRVWYAKADILRYEVLHRFGGVYVDADQLCLRGFDDLLEADTAFFAGYQNLANPDISAEDRETTLIANAVIGTEPGHPVLERVIRTIGQGGRSDVQPWIQVGPGALTRAIQETPARVLLYPFHQFYPYHSSEIIPQWPVEMTKAIHYESHSVSLWGSTIRSYRRCRLGPRGKAPLAAARIARGFAEGHPILAPIRFDGGDAGP